MENPTNQQTPPPAPPGYYQQTDLPMPVDPDRTLYNSSFLGLISRNFLAGFFRALGTVVVYLAFMVIMGLLVSRFLYPRIQPFLETFERLGKLQMQQSQMDTSNIDVDTIMEQLRN